ncbi:ABC transporter permease [Spirillospora sp. NPDC050679]
MSPLAVGDDGEPLIRWEWIGNNLGDDIAEALREHLILSFTPVLLGFLIALPLGLACARWKRLYQPTLAVTSILYALPAIALFVILIAFTGLTYTTVVIPLTLYTLSVLVPGVVDGLAAVPDHVRQAATAMGFGPLRRLVQVELPIALPVVMAGLRVATVSNISLVSVGAIMGLGGLGQLFTTGLQRDFPTPIVVGVVLVILLALLSDLVLLAVQRAFTPWERAGGTRRRKTADQAMMPGGGAA